MKPKFVAISLLSKTMQKWDHVLFLKQVLLNWDSQQGKPFSIPSQKNFPISFEPKVAMAEFHWKIQRKTWYSILGLDAMPLSLKNLLLIQTGLQYKPLHMQNA